MVVVVLKGEGGRGGGGKGISVCVCVETDVSCPGDTTKRPTPPATLPPSGPTSQTHTSHISHTHHSTSPVRFLTLSSRAMVNSRGLLLSASTPTAVAASALP